MDQFISKIYNLEHVCETGRGLTIVLKKIKKWEMNKIFGPWLIKIPLIKLNSSLAVRRLEYHQEMDNKASERKIFKVEERGFILERIDHMTNRMALWLREARVQSDGEDCHLKVSQMAILRKKYAKENIAIEAKRKRRPVWRRSGRKKPVFKKESTAQVASSGLQHRTRHDSNQRVPHGGGVRHGHSEEGQFRRWQQRGKERPFSKLANDTVALCYDHSQDTLSVAANISCNRQIRKKDVTFLFHYILPCLDLM